MNYLYVVSHITLIKCVIYSTLEDAIEAAEVLQETNRGWEITKVREGEMFEGMLLEPATHKVSSKALKDSETQADTWSTSQTPYVGGKA